MLGEAYDIEPTEEARLILIAPSFSDRLQKIAKYVDISLQLLKYTALEMKGERAVLTEEVTNTCNSNLYEKLTIEHIFPKDPTFYFPSHKFQNKQEYLSNLHKIGNLILLEEKINKRIKK